MARNGWFRGLRDQYCKTMLTSSKSEMEAALKCAADHALQFLNGLDRRPAHATASRNSLRDRLDRPLHDTGMAAEDVIRFLVEAIDGGLTAMPSGRFFAWVIGGALPSALAADWLASAWGQNAALYASSPAASTVEEVAGRWLKDVLRLPESASYAFVTGCQMAHVTCLAAARHALLRKRNWDVERQGLAGAPMIRVISSVNRHASLEKAVRLLGFGTDCMISLRPSNRDTLQAWTLEAELAKSSAPTIVLLQAGEINTGAFDEFSLLIPLAKRYGAWVHIDGAFGLWAVASERFRYLTQGVNQADSWATDGHKWLNVPFDCGYAFVRDATAHRGAMSVSAPYIAAGDGVRDEIDWNPEWSRRARGFATYAALSELGRHGLSELIERTCRYASDIVAALSALPGVDVLWRPILNQGLIRFLDRGADATDADHDRRTESVIEAIVATGEAFFAPTTWREKRAMRVSVLNWRTCDDDVRRTIDAVRRVLSGDDPS
jgi:glutamate/tyrosine decarboxylase-like PLP-dependent enzyme